MVVELLLLHLESRRQRGVLQSKKPVQEQSLECLNATQILVEKSDTNFSTLTKVVVQTIVQWMASIQQDITEMRDVRAMRSESEKESISECDRRKLEPRENLTQSINAGVDPLRRAGPLPGV